MRPFLALSLLYTLAPCAVARDYHAADRGGIDIPVDNTLGKKALTGVRLTIKSNSTWIKILPVPSKLGPMTISAGQKDTFRIEYKVLVETSAPWIDIAYQLSMDPSPGVNSEYNCVYKITGDSGDSGGCTDSSGEILTYQPAPDTTPPQSTATLSMAAYIDASGRSYLSTNALIQLDAKDPTIQWAEYSGSPIIYVATGPTSTTLGGYQPYQGSFHLSTGTQTVSFYSVDAAGNKEAPHALSFFVVGTEEPKTRIEFIGSGKFIGKGHISLDSRSSLRLTAVSAVPSVGILQLAASVDGKPPFSVIAPIKFSPGSHTLTYFSMDNLLNSEPYQRFAVFVDVPPDTTPPVTALYGDNLAITGAAILNSSTSFSLVSSDGSDGIGVGQIYYFVDVTTQACASATKYDPTPGSCFNNFYQSSFTLVSGTHTIGYWAEDMAGNVEAKKSAVVTVSPPGTTRAPKKRRP